MTRSSSGKIRPAAGVVDEIAKKARGRRRTQRALAEIEGHSRTRRNDLLPDLQLEYLPVDRLRPAPRRVRRKDPAQHARLTASIDAFGLLPILVTGDGEIIDGHSVWEIARQKRIPTIPCVIADHLSPGQLRVLRIALNRLGETGQWDEQALKLELQELILLEEDVLVTGFSEAEIDGLLLDDLGHELSIEEPLPGLSQPVISRPGDLWRLGDHLLLHGDCREAAAYDRLMGDDLARLVFTDEPYNLAVKSLVSTPHREFAMASGEMDRTEFADFQAAWMKPALDRVIDGGLLATFIDWRGIEIVLAAGRALELELLNIVTWAKANGGQGSLWRSQTEFLPFFKKGRAPHINNVQLGR